MRTRTSRASGLLLLALLSSLSACGDLAPTGDDDVGGTDSGSADASTDGSGSSGSDSDGSGSDSSDSDSDSSSSDTGSDAGTDGGSETGSSSDTGEGSTGSDAGTETGTETDTEPPGPAFTCAGLIDYLDCDGPDEALDEDPFHAIGIDCPGPSDQTIKAESAVMSALDPDSYRVCTRFGSANGPNYNGKLWAANGEPWLSPSDELLPANTSSSILVLTTGTINPASATGTCYEAGSQQFKGPNDNLDGGGMPAPLTPAMGSNGGLGGTPFMNCDGVNDCSDSLYEQWVNQGWNEPYDKLWMQVDLKVPSDAQGYVFDFAYFSAEFPKYYNTKYNDLFIVWSTSESYTGNVTFVNGAPLTITSLEDAGAFQYEGDVPAFWGTGFTGFAGTGWYVARGSTIPGEEFQLTFFLADMGDKQLATMVLLDNFRWDCAGCEPSEVDSCGIAPV